MQMRYDALDALVSQTRGVRVRLVEGSVLPEAASVLTAEEEARLAGFGSADRRLHFALGRVALRTLAGERLGVPAGSVALRVAPDGAVDLDGFHVSISHGGHRGAAVGFAALSSRPVGVDVEPIRPRRADLWTRILRPDERPALDALGGSSDEAHTLLWSMKEAVLKGQRTGLRAGARSVRLGLPPGAGLAAGSATAYADRSGAWSVRYLRRGDLWLVLAISEESSGQDV